MFAPLVKYANRDRAAVLQRFFKTGPGQYGAGDKFIGATVPQVRQVAKANLNLSWLKIKKLLASPIHEERLLALLILVEKFKPGSEADQRQIVKFYLENLNRINNWDLVDLSADKILGMWLLTRSRKKLYHLAKSKNIWHRRVAVLSTYQFIRHNDFDDILALADLLLTDRHDLIHKATGWMLREVGKRSPQTLKTYLDRQAAQMPRTMLRYAIEKLPEEKRQYYLNKKAARST